MASVEVRARREYNNVDEQEHRGLKQRCAPMLSLKRFRPTAITLAGIAFGHHIRKRHYSLPPGTNERARSLQERWAPALDDSGGPTDRDEARHLPRHQISAHRLQASRERTRVDGRLRNPRKRSFAGNLYLRMRPQGGRYWHYHYRYAGRRKTLSPRAFPDVPVARARSRHLTARQLPAADMDPTLRRVDLRTWQVADGALGSQRPARQALSSRGEWLMLWPHYSTMVTQIRVP